MLFQIVTLLWIVARPVAASSVEGDLKPLKILTLGKRSQCCHLVAQEPPC
jgi:hypothetical protein